MAEKQPIAAISSEILQANAREPKPAEKTGPKSPKEPKPPKEAKPAKEPKPPKEAKPPKEPKSPKEPKPKADKPKKDPTQSRGAKPQKEAKPPKPPKPPIAPPGPIMSKLLLPVPFAQGGCCGETLPFFISCIIMAIAGIVASLANLVLILAYTLAYSEDTWDPNSEKCVNAWWERDVPFFYLFNLPPIILVLHVVLLIAYIGSCILLIVSSSLGHGTLLRINSLIGFGLLFPTFAVGMAEVMIMSEPAWLHWNMLILSAFTLIFLYSVMIVNGYDKRLQHPIKDDDNEDII